MDDKGFVKIDKRVLQELRVFKAVNNHRSFTDCIHILLQQNKSK